MSVRNIKVLLVAICVLPFLSACTTKKKSGAVAMAIPSTLKSNKVGALAITLPVRHVIINISGQDIGDGYWDAKTWSWDAHSCEEQNSYASCAPPGSINLPDIPGGAKLVQVMFVAGLDDSANEFWYGKASIEVNGDTEAAITLNPYPGVASSSDGRIVGRYYATIPGTSTVINPSGVINIRFPLAAGERPILLERAEMYNGWFQAFSLADIDLRYDLDGEPQLPARYPLFTAGTGLYKVGGTLIAANDDKVRASIPINYAAWDGRKEDQTLVTIGSFGDGVGANPTMKAITPTGGLMNNRIKISPSVPAYLSSTDITYSHDGTALASNGSTQFVDYIKFNYQGYNSQGRDGAAGFKGPFMGSIVNGQLTYVQVAGTPPAAADLQWTYMPGVENYIDGVKVYIRENQNGGSGQDYRLNGDGIDCASLTSYGFVDLTPGTMVAKNLNTLTGVDLSDYNSATIILCPMKTGVKLYSAAESYVDSLGGAPPTTGAYNPNLLTIKGPDKIFSGGTCAPFKVEAFRNLKPSSFGDFADVTLTSSDANITLHELADCSDTPTVPMTATIPNPEDNGYIFYAKIQISTPATSAYSVTASFTDGTSTLAKTGSFYVALSPAWDPSFQKLRIVAPAVIKAQECYPAIALPVYTQTGYGHIYNAPSIDFDTTAFTTDFDFFEDDGVAKPCELAIPPGPVSIPEGSARFFFRYKGTATSVALNVTPDGTNFTGTIPTLMTVAHPMEAAGFRIETSQQGNANICQPVRILAVDRRGNPAMITTATSVKLTDMSGTGAFYGTEANCTGSVSAITSPISFLAGQGQKVVYFRATSGTSLIIANNTQWLSAQQVYVGP